MMMMMMMTHLMCVCVCVCVCVPECACVGLCVRATTFFALPLSLVSTTVSPGVSACRFSSPMFEGYADTTPAPCTFANAIVRTYKGRAWRPCCTVGPWSSLGGVAYVFA